MLSASLNKTFPSFLFFLFFGGAGMSLSVRLVSIVGFSSHTQRDSVEGGVRVQDQHATARGFVYDRPLVWPCSVHTLQTDLQRLPRRRPPSRLQHLHQQRTETRSAIKFVKSVKLGHSCLFVFSFLPCLCVFWGGL